MISTAELEKRIFDYFNTLFGANALAFGFNANVGERFICENQTNAPRPSADTIAYFRIEYNRPMGIASGSSHSKIDRTTGLESVEVWRDVQVVFNVLSAKRGLAKDTMNFLYASVNSERDRVASLEVLPFDLLLYRIGDDRNLTALETENWQERVEVDMWFNYTDLVDIDSVQFLTQPVVPEDVPNIIEWDTKIKVGK